MLMEMRGPRAGRLAWLLVLTVMLAVFVLAVASIHEMSAAAVPQAFPSPQPAPVGP